MPEALEGLVEIGHYRDEEEAHEHGLVVLSQGRPYWILEDSETGFRLLVEAEYAEQLFHQLNLFDQESMNWPPMSAEMPAASAATDAAVAWVGLLVMSFLCQIQWPQLVEAGRLSSEAFREGELHRPFTALFLHADIGHLVGNAVFGAIFLFLVARHTGGWIAWGGVLLAGTVGNILNALLHFETQHYSIGASTAVFGAVGMLVALPVGFIIRHSPRHLMESWAIPLVVGLIFLAWFGTGGEFTDTSAHLTGFLSGLPIGLLAGLLVKSEEDQNTTDSP